jgi:hypothetical protein
MLPEKRPRRGGARRGLIRKSYSGGEYSRTYTPPRALGLEKNYDIGAALAAAKKRAAESVPPNDDLAPNYGVLVTAIPNDGEFHFAIWHTLPFAQAIFDDLRQNPDIAVSLIARVRSAALKFYPPLDSEAQS